MNLFVLLILLSTAPLEPHKAFMERVCKPLCKDIELDWVRPGPFAPIEAWTECVCMESVEC